MRRILTLALAAVALPAAAHSGPGLEAASFAAGLGHLFTGLDHLVALLASGFLAARLSRNSGLALLVAVLVVLAGGAIFAHGMTGWSWVEAGIAVMLMALDAWLLLPVQQARALKIATVIAFGLFQGAVHRPRRRSVYPCALGALPDRSVHGQRHCLGCGLAGLSAVRLP